MVRLYYLQIKSIYRCLAIVDDGLAAVMTENAARQGLSVSALTRLILKNTFSKGKSFNLLDQGLIDISNGEVEKTTLHDFKKEIGTLKDA